MVPTACSTLVSYNNKVGKINKFFADAYGVTPVVLHGFEEKPTPTRVAQEIGKASLIYTIGGKTPHMLELLRTWKADIALVEAMRAGKAHSGVSAGALLPFHKIHTNPEAKPKENEWDFDVLDGLGVLRGVATAHANLHDPTPSGERPDSRLENLQTTLFPADCTIGIGLDHGASVIFSSEGPLIIQSEQTPNAQVHLLERGEDNHTVNSHLVQDPAELLRFMLRQEV